MNYASLDLKVVIRNTKAIFGTQHFITILIFHIYLPDRKIPITYFVFIGTISGNKLFLDLVSNSVFGQ